MSTPVILARMWGEWSAAFVRIHSERGGEIVSERLGNISCPFLVIHGDRDALVDPVHPELMSSRIPGARLHRSTPV